MVVDEAAFKTIAEVARRFGMTAIGVYPVTVGKVNQTYRVECSENGENGGPSGNASYIFQKVNTYVFNNPHHVMDNIERVSRVVKGLVCRRTLYGVTYLEYGESYWRVYNYIDSVTYNSTKDLGVVRSGGAAFGRFQSQLRDFDPSTLHFTIPDFHNTAKRFETLAADYQEDSMSRAYNCMEETEYVLSMKDKALVLDRLYKAGRIPLRVTHNDTKINNVLFDKDTGEAICVIDLDTVMPGLAGHDFGDAVRSAGNSMGSASLEFDRIRIDLEVFRAFAEGFLSETRSFLTDDEIGSLPDSCLVMTLELASRYLDDYLTGDRYFKAGYGTQNLDRARNLIALARDMDRNMESMRSIICSIVRK